MCKCDDNKRQPYCGDGDCVPYKASHEKAKKVSSKVLRVDGTPCLEIKRFYLPLEVETECPSCNRKVVKDFEDEYLSYPTINEEIDIHVYCEGCENEYKFKASLGVTMTVSTEMTKY